MIENEEVLRARLKTAIQIGQESADCAIDRSLMTFRLLRAIESAIYLLDQGQPGKARKHLLDLVEAEKKRVRRKREGKLK